MSLRREFDAAETIAVNVRDPIMFCESFIQKCVIAAQQIEHAAIFMYDARENTLDQQFYDDFGQMLDQVMVFVADSLDQPLD